jgi:hypothetical protein
MLVAHGLGQPGGLLVSGGLGRGMYVPIVWLPDVAPFELIATDPQALLVVDPGALCFEDCVAVLAYDRGPDMCADMRLCAIDRDCPTRTRIQLELRRDPSREVIR